MSNTVTALRPVPNPPPAVVAVAERPSQSPANEGLIARPLTAFLLALGGALAFVAGATLGVWPLWTVGLVAVCASIVAYRP